MAGREIKLKTLKIPGLGDDIPLRREALDLPASVTPEDISESFWGRKWRKDQKVVTPSKFFPNVVRYARFEKGRILAVVDAAGNFTVELNVKPVSPERWAEFKRQCLARVALTVDVLNGRFSEGLIDLLTNQEYGLFPDASDISYVCSCQPVKSRMAFCPHFFAVLRVLFVRLEESPDYIFKLRSLDPFELLATCQEFLGSERPTEEALAGVNLSALFGILVASPPPTRGESLFKELGLASDFGLMADLLPTLEPAKPPEPEMTQGAQVGPEIQEDQEVEGPIESAIALEAQEVQEFQETQEVPEAQEAQVVQGAQGDQEAQEAQEFQEDQEVEGSIESAIALEAQETKEFQWPQRAQGVQDVEWSIKPAIALEAQEFQGIQKFQEDQEVEGSIESAIALEAQETKEFQWPQRAQGGQDVEGPIKPAIALEVQEFQGSQEAQEAQEVEGATEPASAGAQEAQGTQEVEGSKDPALAEALEAQGTQEVEWSKDPALAEALEVQETQEIQEPQEILKAQRPAESPESSSSQEFYESQLAPAAQEAKDVEETEEPAEPRTLENTAPSADELAILKRKDEESAKPLDPPESRPKENRREPGWRVVERALRLIASQESQASEARKNLSPDPSPVPSPVPSPDPSPVPRPPKGGGSPKAILPPDLAEEFRKMIKRRNNSVF